MSKKITILFSLLTITCFSQTYIEKTLKKHQEKVSKSKENGTIIKSLDTIYNKGIPYAVLKTIRESILHSDYMLLSIDGKELMAMKWEEKKDKKLESYYSFLFLEKAERAELKWNLEFNAEKFIVENNIVENNNINTSAKNKLLLLYPPTYSSQNNSNTGSTKALVQSDLSRYQTVDRNRNAIIQKFGDEFSQDFKTIGVVKESKTAIKGTIFKISSFYLPNGTLVAEVTAEGITNKVYTVVTMKDNMTHTVKVSFGKDALEIAEYLSKKYYL